MPSYDSTLFNVSPYYDDFDEDKKFHRIIFKPGYAVQARELTQSQTILQNQIERFGNHIFKEGSRVLGSEIVANSTSYIRMLPYYGVVNGITQFLDLSRFENKVIQQGEGDNATKAKVVHTRGPYSQNYDNYSVFFIDFLRGSGFTAGEEVLVSGAGATAIVAPAPGTTASNGHTAAGGIDQGITVDAIFQDGITGNAKIIQVTPGIYFVNGSFVRNSTQKVAPFALTGDNSAVRYFKNPTSKIGFNVTQDIITSSDDFSLRDPSAGSYNYNAPGADRYKIDLQLSHTDAGLGLNRDGIPIPIKYTNFIELMRYREGRITYKNIYTQYNELEKTLARRTYDESGNYTVRPFNINIKEHLDNGTNNGVWAAGRTSDGGIGATSGYLACALEPGKAYIFGHEFETQATEYVDIRKARGEDHERELDLYRPNSSEDHGIWFYATAGPDFASLYDTDVVARDITTDLWRSVHFWGNTADSGIYDDDSRDKGIGDGGCFLGYGWVERVEPLLYTKGDALQGAVVGAPVLMENPDGVMEPAYKVTVIGCGRRRPLASEGNLRPLKWLSNATSITQRKYPTSKLNENWQTGILPDYAEQYTADSTIVSRRELRVLRPFRPDYILSPLIEAPRHNRIMQWSWNNRSLMFWNDRGNASTKVSHLKYDFAWMFTVSSTDAGEPGGNFVPHTGEGNDANFAHGYIEFDIPSSWGNGIDIQTYFASQNNQTTHPYTLSGHAKKKLILIGKDTTNQGEGEPELKGEVIDLIDWNVSFPGGNGDRTIRLEPTTTSNQIEASHKYILNANVRVNDEKLDESTIATKRYKTTIETRPMAQEDAAGNPKVPSYVRGYADSIFLYLTKNDIHHISKIELIDHTNNGAITDVTDDFLVWSGHNRYVTSSAFLYAKSGTRISEMVLRDSSGNYAGITALDSSGATFPAVRTTYSYFKRTQPSSNGMPSPCIVNSYLNGGVTLDLIPIENLYSTRKVSRPHSLTSMVDFRLQSPYHITNSGYKWKNAGGCNIIPGSMSIKHNYMLPRVDKVVLTNKLGSQSSTFQIIEGRPAEVPLPPDDRSDSLTLYSLIVPPYTFNSSDVIMNQVNHQRYTMKDIGRLDKKITAVEHYASLSLLEKEILGKQMFRGAEGGEGSSGDYELFKAAIMVDQFVGHNRGDVGKFDYRCSIDKENNTLRPFFDLRQFVPMSDSTTTTDTVVTTSDGLVMMKTTGTADFVFQDKASISISVNPFNLVNWLGDLKINPPSSRLMDMRRRPILKTFSEGLNDNWRANTIGGQGAPVDFVDRTLRGFGSQWNDWESIWCGIDLGDNEFYSERGKMLVSKAYTKRYDISTQGLFYSRSGAEAPRTTETIDQMKTAAGIRARNNPEQITTEINNKIVDKSIVPYIRQETLTISGTGMRPNTTVYCFFDDRDVNSSCSLSDGSVGPFKTNEHGEVATSDGIISDITFIIPSGVFLTGEKLFRLTDNDINDVFQSTTAAEAIYFAVGQQSLNEEFGINSTRPAIIKRQTVTSNKIVRDITTRNQTIDTSINTQWVDPLSQTFTVGVNDYPDGMFLKSVGLYFSNKDEFDPITIEIRPLLNGKPHGSHSLPFSRVTKNPSDINIDVTTPSVQTEFVFSSPVYLTPGDYAIVIKSNSVDTQLWAAEVGGTDIDTNQLIDSQPYSGVLFQPQNSSVAEMNQALDLKFRLINCLFDTTPGNITIPFVSIEGDDSTEVHLLRMNSNDLRPHNTNLSWKVWWGDGAGGGNTRIYPNENIDIKASLDSGGLPEYRKIVPGDDVNNDTMLKVSMSGTNLVTPVVDLKNLDMYAVRNVVNNVARTEASRWAWGWTTQKAASRYISRRVNLSEGIQANHLRVFLDINQEEDRRNLQVDPAGNPLVNLDPLGIQVWIKYQESDGSGEQAGTDYDNQESNSEEEDILSNADTDQEDFDSKRYYKMSLFNNPFSNGPSETEFDFREVEWRLPFYLDPDAHEMIGTFAIKIVMFAHDRSRPPQVKNLRAVALVG